MAGRLRMVEVMLSVLEKSNKNSKLFKGFQSDAVHIFKQCFASEENFKKFILILKLIFDFLK